MLSVSQAQTETPQLPAAPKAAVSTGMKNIDLAAFEKMRSEKTNVVLDVRTPKEFAAGHVPGAVNIDVKAGDFDEKVAKLDKNKTYLVHCGAGVRSTTACKKLELKGFPSLYNFKGGYNAWEKAGHKGVKD